MSDPERLIDAAGTPEQRLLSSALDESPPPDLLARTLGVVGAAAPAALATAAAAKAGSAAAAKVAGGGIWGAVLAGTVAGVVTVAGYGALAGRDPAPAPSPSPVAPAVVVAVVAPRPAPSPVATIAAEPPAPVPSAAPAAASAPRPGALAAELSILDEARRALNEGDRSRARALLDHYAREVPRGQLGREAARLRADVDAIADAGLTIP